MKIYGFLVGIARETNFVIIFDNLGKIMKNERTNFEWKNEMFFQGGRENTKSCLMFMEIKLICF